MNIQQVYREFEYRLNKSGTNANQLFGFHWFVSLVNKAQLHWAEARAKVIERDQTRVDELQLLLRDHKATAVKQENFYKVTLPEDYFHRVRAYTSSSCGPLYIKMVEEGNINTLLANEFTRPSAAWEEALGTLFKGQLRVYSDVKPGDIHLKYVRLPKNVDIAGYVNRDGTASSDIDMEFDGGDAQEIIDLAVQLASADIGDRDRYATASQHLQTHN